GTLHDGGPLAGRHATVAECHWARGRHGFWLGQVPREGRCGPQRRGGVDRGEPRDTGPASHHHARDDQHTVAVVVEREGTERDRTRPREVHLVPHHDARERLAPAFLGELEATRTA